MQLSQEHNLQLEGERDRVASSSAILMTERDVRGSGDDITPYICRERRGSIVYGIKFTRSIGDADAHAHLGVVSAPDVATIRLTRDDRVVVLATDGVWDLMSNEEVTSIATSYDDPYEASRAITDRARRLWAANHTDGRRDDITALVIFTKLIPAGREAHWDDETPPEADGPPGHVPLEDMSSGIDVEDSA